jgi:hypothetical protein
LLFNCIGNQYHEEFEKRPFNCGNKKGLDGNPAPFLNPISYEKPIMRPLL